MSPTTQVKRIEGGAPHNEDNGKVDTDQTLVKTVDSEPANNPLEASSPRQIVHQQGYDRSSMELPPPQSGPMNTNEASVAHSDLHRVPLHRAQGRPQVRITMPPSNDVHNAVTEGSSMMPGQESPDTFVTEASVDETARPSMSRRTDDTHLYRNDVNQPEREELPQPVENIPEEFGIQVRQNPQEYLR